jgi:5'-AMP-activated protein kinase catalytic alpha subunit
LKFIDKNLIIEEDLAQNIKTELNLMKTISHPFIVYLYEILSSAQKIIFVMEYIEGGDLFDEIKRGEGERLDEDSSRKYFQQIITALEYCHSKNIIHRDLKPENILFDQIGGCIKISDFGLATILKEKDEKLSDFCGTTNYIAPEIIKETGKIFSSGGYTGQPADIWSSGVILYNMVSGENPFYHYDKAININNILNANIEYPSYFSDSLIDLLKHIFITQPKLRYTIEDIKNHPWFQKDFININDNTINKCNTNITHKHSKSNFNLDNNPLAQDHLIINVNEIPFANCFVISSILTGKWLSCMLKETQSKNDVNGTNKKSGFDIKEHYEFYVNKEWSVVEKILNEFYLDYKGRIKFCYEGTMWKVEIKMNDNGKERIKFNMMVYKITKKNDKYVLCFECKDKNKITFAKVMKRFIEKGGEFVKVF